MCGREWSALARKIIQTSNPTDAEINDALTEVLGLHNGGAAVLEPLLETGRVDTRQLVVWMCHTMDATPVGRETCYNELGHHYAQRLSVEFPATKNDDDSESESWMYDAAF
jgi:hypothetical protein